MSETTHFLLVIKMLFAIVAVIYFYLWYRFLNRRKWGW